MSLSLLRVQLKLDQWELSVILNSLYIFMSKKYIEPDKNLFCPNPSSEAVLTPQYDPSSPESIPIHQRYCTPPQTLFGTFPYGCQYKRGNQYYQYLKYLQLSIYYYVFKCFDSTTQAGLVGVVIYFKRFKTVQIFRSLSSEQDSLMSRQLVSVFFRICPEVIVTC